MKADPLITFDNQLAKVLSPIERLLGVTLLGTATVQSFRNVNNNNNNGVSASKTRRPHADPEHPAASKAAECSGSGDLLVLPAATVDNLEAE